MLPSCAGSLSMANTPKGVEFYLDQVAKSHALGANSAAIAMYRGALEHLLFDQGYTKGMLNTKIQQLEADIHGGTAKSWAAQLETEYLAVMKDLGNGSIHPNDGDISKQKILDNELLSRVQVMMTGLLYSVYEAPVHRNANLTALKNAASALKR